MKTDPEFDDMLNDRLRNALSELGVTISDELFKSFSLNDTRKFFKLVDTFLLMRD